MTLLAELGAHFVGGGLISSVSMPTATLPYAGLRLGMGSGNHRGHGDWGVWLYGRADLARETVVATPLSCETLTPSVSAVPLARWVI